ncbi:hypothetical protein BDZ91DRAFT_718202 [Kalaharituber pfeilii]|nr:hypothetical protein BDZ91DRAFT_718202 [Kalaharituber pfeilii]
MTHILGYIHRSCYFLFLRSFLNFDISCCWITLSWLLCRSILYYCRPMVKILSSFFLPLIYSTQCS